MKNWRNNYTSVEETSNNTLNMYDLPSRNFLEQGKLQKSPLPFQFKEPRIKTVVANCMEFMLNVYISNPVTDV
jgi:hypothetical protein